MLYHIQKTLADTAGNPYVSQQILVTRSRTNTPERLYNMEGSPFSYEGLTTTDANGVIDTYIGNLNAVDFTVYSSAGQPVARVTDVQPFTATRSGGGEGSSGGGGTSLTNVTENFTHASPNASRPAEVLAASGTDGHIDLVLSPKGVGALLAVLPDNGNLGGNKRGQYAVDLQIYRTFAAAVASGNNAVIVGGSDNMADHTYSFIGGGSENETSGDYSVVTGGASNTVNTGADFAVIAGGQTNTLSGQYSGVLSGYQGTDRGSNFTQVSGVRNNQMTGNPQWAVQALAAETTDGTATMLSAGVDQGVAANQAILADYSVFKFKAEVVARDFGSNDVSAFEVSGVIKRGSGVGSVAFVGTPVVTNIAADSSATSWQCVAVANTTLGTLAVQVTGETAKTIDWMAKVSTVQIG
jgi:hypothetical protein